MAAFKVVQKIASVNGNATSGSIALKSGYLRVTPAGGDAFVEVGTNSFSHIQAIIGMKIGVVMCRITASANGIRAREEYQAHMARIPKTARHMSGRKFVG